MTDSEQRNVSLKPYSTLRAGGCGERLVRCRSANSLADWAIASQNSGEAPLVIGMGSNMLPSDSGVPGLLLVNCATSIAIKPGGNVQASTGIALQDLFLKTAQAGLGGLEYAVGIPGTLGGALVSNAGAYRSSISEFLTRIEIVEGGIRTWVDPAYLEFSYRDSLLRRNPGRGICLLQVEMKLEERDAKAIYDEARDYQRQRISKQPPSASCGSFFKNVFDKGLASELSGLREDLRASGVVPAGALLERVGIKGLSYRGAKFSERHANFLMNVGGATASSLRSLADFAKAKVFDEFGVLLEEEVLYLGDWSNYQPEPIVEASR